MSVLATPTVDMSARVLTDHLSNREPFTFARVGDGDIYYAFELSGFGTGAFADTNGEVGNPDICRRTREAIKEIPQLPGIVYFGDYLSRTSGDCGLSNEWEEITGWIAGCPLLHVESLLLHRLSQSLLNFYRVLAFDKRPKVYVAPERMQGGARMVDADLLTTPLSTAHQFIDEYVDRLTDGDWEIVLLSAGRSTKPIIAGAAAKRPDRTYIDVGSALDILFVGNTRTGQVTQEAASAYFRELL